MQITKNPRAMLILTGIVAVSIGIGCGGNSGGGADTGGPINLDSDTAKASYAIGVNLGQNFKSSYLDIDTRVLARGVADAMGDGELMMTEMEMMEAMNTLQSAQQQRMAQEGAANLQEATSYIVENASKDGVTTLPDSLQYEVLVEGDGPTPKPGDTVRVHYTGTFMDGTTFDSSVDRGEPIEFQVESGQIIRGWDEIVQLMPVGSKWRVSIPPELAYGAAGRGAIPPNSLLIFEIELLEIVEPSDG